MLNSTANLLVHRLRALFLVERWLSCSIAVRLIAGPIAFCCSRALLVVIFVVTGAVEVTNKRRALRIVPQPSIDIFQCVLYKST